MNCHDILKKGCSKLNISLSAENIDRLVLYYTELMKWNRKMNLVARAGEKETLESHFLDSLTLLPFILSEGHASLLDVGTGAGFPGLVIKAVCPELNLTLCEPRAKRVTFLRHIVRTLRLDQVKIMAERLKPLPEEDVQQYPLITSRAVTSINDFLALVKGHCRTGGIIICMKGPRAEEEISQWRTNAPASPFRLMNIIEKTLPFSGAQRNLILFQKN